MGTRRIKARSRNTGVRPVIEYYHIPFAILGSELEKSYELSHPHPARASYWNVVPSGRYSPQQGRELLLQYSAVLERYLAEELSQHSIAYWLHGYRRLAPGPSGENDAPATITIVRGVVEAAVQKYGRLTPCDGIAWSNEIREQEVIGGLLMGPGLRELRAALRKAPQLVLTKFGVRELKQLYLIEKLAYEVWRSGAALRIIGKGAPLVVDHSSRSFFHDDRSPELDRLVTIYDERAGIFAASATGTVFVHTPKDWTGGVLLPIYNADRKGDPGVRSFLKHFGVELATGETNFLWAPFNLHGYYEAHLPFAEPFEAANGVALRDVFAVIGALLLRVAAGWVGHREFVWRSWQRAYDAPSTRGNIVGSINDFLPESLKLLNVQCEPGAIDVQAVFNFLELDGKKRESICVLLWGPHSLFVPLDEHRVFIDFAWMNRLLYNMFFGIKMKDQQFKGAALEQTVHSGASALPTEACNALGGTSRQIDAAFDLGDTLVIAECRAVWRSIAIERGDPEAIAFRIAKCERALRDTDEKATWLAANPVGTNYDVRKHTTILPIAVTPFPEYIPSLAPNYWVTEKLPRVMTPYELKGALADGTLASAAPHCPAAVKLS